MANTTDTRAERGHERLDEAGLTYRPYLDGLRCLAVYLVVAFHSALRGFSGGYIGVDVFFVLSGYLVTRILLRDLVNRSNIDFVRFYARRFRRILPAAATMLALTALAYVAVATPLEVSDAAGGFRAAFLYFANWHFIQQSTDYFAPSVNASPVLHFWSLAVEEQFYLTWPLLLGGLYFLSKRTGHHRWWVLRSSVALIAVVSLVDALHYGPGELNRAYYGTDTRTYQLLAGAFLALTPELVSMGRGFSLAARRTAIVALGGLLVLGTSIVHVSPIGRGVLVVAATMALIVALERSPDGEATRVLSSSRIAYLGRISYGTYLWHWPVIIILTHGREFDSTPLFLITVALATGLAAISYHVLEHPIRASRWLDSRGKQVITVALAVSLTGGVLIAPVVRAAADRGAHISSVSINVPSLDTGAVKMTDWRAARDDIPAAPECLGRPISSCTLVRGTGKRVLLMGDSLARMWIPAFTAIARRESFTLVLASHPSCPWPQGLGGLGISTTCPAQRADWYNRVVPEFDPDIIFLANRPYDAPGNLLPMAVSGRRVTAQDPLGQNAIATSTERSLHLLSRPGRTLVIIEPTPLPERLDFDPLSCVSSGSAHCSFTVSTPVTALDEVYRNLGTGPDVKTLELNRLACPRLPVCDPVVNDIIVRRDHTHLTATYVLALSNALQSILHDQGILG
jgi:peptidoglycan/LPS O-acetylase OafA/YrhL